MADVRRIIAVPIDVSDATRKSLSGTALSDPATAMNLYRGTQILFQFTLYNGASTVPFVIEAGTTYYFGIDNSYVRDHSDLVTSPNSEFVSTDWGSWDIATGKICCRADLTTDALKTALADSASATMYCGLWMMPLAGKYTLLGQWSVTMNNIAVDPTSVTQPISIQYAPVDYVDAQVSQIEAPTGGAYTLSGGVLKLWNPDQSIFQTVTLNGAAGAEKISIAAS